MLMERWKVIRKLINELWLPASLATAIASYRIWHDARGIDTFLAYFGGSFVVIYFLSATYLKASRQLLEERYRESSTRLLEKACTTLSEMNDKGVLLRKSSGQNVRNIGTKIAKLAKSTVATPDCDEHLANIWSPRVMEQYREFKKAYVASGTCRRALYNG